MKCRIVCYRLEARPGSRSLILPVEAAVLGATYHQGALGLWVQVPTNPGVERTVRFELVETGHPFEVSLELGARYLGTCEAPGGGFVMHVLERIETKAEPPWPT